MPQTPDPPWTSTSETWLRPVSEPCILMERSFKYRVFQTLKWVGFSVTAKKRFYKPPTLHTSGRCQQAFWGAFLDNRGSQTLFIYEIYTLWLTLPSFDKSDIHLCWNVFSTTWNSFPKYSPQINCISKYLLSTHLLNQNLRGCKEETLKLSKRFSH